MKYLNNFIIAIGYIIHALWWILVFLAIVPIMAVLFVLIYLIHWIYSAIVWLYFIYYNQLFSK